MKFSATNYGERTFCGVRKTGKFCDKILAIL